MAMTQCRECGQEISDQAESCPHCGAPANVKPPQRAKIKTKSDFAGVGCLIQGIGIVCLFFFPVGTIIGVVLLLVGSMKSFYDVCSNCGQKLESRRVKQCAGCGSSFG
jgi:rRNA maturation endonuclease Nob1